jgi:flavin reductase (DIM6/NTAB) family NADH-FMN oxidoreductase RutF
MITTIFEKNQYMSKILWKPGTMIYPLPAVMVSCGSEPGEYNIVTISWTGTICTDPAMCYISVRPSRHSYSIIKKNGEFVINLTTKSLVFAADWCGVKSGADHDKFKEMGLTPGKASKVKAPLIMESPVNIECIVKEIKELGTHHMFISEVVAVNAEKELIDEKSGLFRLNDEIPICYSHGKYYETGKFIGKFGFSVEKKKKIKT